MVVQDEVVFDAEIFKEKNTSSGEDSDSDSDDGQSIFRSKATLTSKHQEVPLVRTRSQTMSQKDDHLGKIVVAHKGKLIPCLFPGKIEEKTSKGYLVQV